jgi:hypothetical protein
MTMQETDQWKKGRRGEMLSIAVWASFKSILLDVSASANKAAPLLHEVTGNIVSPDHLVMRKTTFFMDTKTKQRHLLWRGGRRDDSDQMPRGPAHGIERRSFRAYQNVERQTGKPVIIAVLCIEDARLLANSLAGLGEPYPSISDSYDIVNWPISHFRRICDFDPVMLRHYFYRQDGTPREAPERMPTAFQLQKWLAMLGPRQGEIEWLIEDLLNRLEDEWEQKAADNRQAKP